MQTESTIFPRTEFSSEVRRISTSSAPRETLRYAQVREDPALEIEALAPLADRTFVVISSGGCTSLSLLALGAGSVVSVDNNATQNDIVELKMAAACSLSRDTAIGFLGAREMSISARMQHYRGLRGALSEGARAYWDRHLAAIERGILGAGSAERFAKWVFALIRMGVHPRARIDRMLHAPSLEEQRKIFRDEWDTPRWRALFPLLFNRFAFRGQFWSPEVRKGGGASEIAKHFRRLFEHTLTELPTKDNYFLHHMFLGRYPVEEPNGVPPYLAKAPMEELPKRRDRLTLVDATLTDYLRSCPSSSVDGFSLSNICEWLPASEQGPLFAEIARTARPGARMCFRNFLGWTDIPSRWRSVFVIDPASEALIARDRSAQQRRFIACNIQPIQV